MADGNAFAADLLERSAAGYAGFSAGLMAQRDPDLRERYGDAAFGSWKTHLTQRLLELAAALAAGEPRMFAARVLWSRKAFAARGRDAAGLRLSLECLREVLTERLPPPAVADATAYIEQALAALDEPEAQGEPATLDPAIPTDRLALQYLQRVLEGDVQGAINAVARSAANGVGVEGAYLRVLLPAQREIGRLWHVGEISVAEEHMVTHATQRAMAVLASQGSPAEPNGKTVVVAAVASNVHDVGLRALADLYQLAGWRTIFLGSDVPMRDLPATLTFFEADLLLLGASLSTQVPKVQQTILAVRERCERDIKIIVGGAAFDEAPSVWEKVGSDAYAPTLDQAVSVGGRLVGLH